MKRLLSALAATILAASFALPVNAAPMFMQKPSKPRPTWSNPSKNGKRGTVIVTGGMAATGTTGTHGGMAATEGNGEIAATMVLVIHAATTATVTTIRATIGRTIRATTLATIRATTLATTLATILARE